MATTPAPTDLHLPGIHNTYRVNDRIFSGSSPEGEEAFRSLQQLGIRTIVSVDGAAPDVATAERFGIRYVHLPVGYDGLPRDRIVDLATVLDLPGAVYVHCHHGKHRGPAAVAALARARCGWSAELADTWMKQAGTDPRYSGLFDDVRSLAPVTAGDLALARPLVGVQRVDDLTRLMVAVDERWENLKLVRAAGWKAPADHPDIDPPHEAVQLIEHYRESARTETARKLGPAFLAAIQAAETEALELERAIRAADSARAQAAFDRSNGHCTRCHEQYRNRAKPKP